MARAGMEQRTPQLGLEMTKNILPRWIQAKGKKFASDFYEHQLLWSWAAIVGPVIAKQVEPMGIRGGVLYLYGPNPVMNHEVRMMETQILEKLNEAAKCDMVKSLYIGRRWEHPDSAGREKIHSELVEKQREKEPLHLGKAIQQTNLTEAELEKARKLASRVEDEDLRVRLQTLYQRQEQLEKVRRRQGWHPCKACGALCDPKEEGGLCSNCTRKRRETIRYQVAQTLRDVPWLRYPEVQHYVPEARPQVVRDVRADMVRSLASKINIAEPDDMAAKRLVMLYRCVPPERLTENVIRRTLYRLRFMLYRPPGYTMPRRYEVIPWGGPKKEAR